MPYSQHRQQHGNSAAAEEAGRTLGGQVCGVLCEPLQHSGLSPPVLPSRLAMHALLQPTMLPEGSFWAIWSGPNAGTASASAREPVLRGRTADVQIGRAVRAVRTAVRAWMDRRRA